MSGRVTYDFVPPVAGLGLDYASATARPVRGATVEIIAAASVIATTKTDTTGRYSASIPSNTSVFVRTKAELVQSGTPSWRFRVVDNTNGDALYALDGPVFSSGAAASTRDVHAPSGWNGTSYATERAAAPFAILDTVFEAASAVVAADPQIALPALDVHWSIDNRPVTAANGERDPATGEIGTTFFSESRGGIFVLGAANVDTDEYDRHVIVHEWGHYLESNLSRNDSIAGPHTRRDLLDLRTAFSEGWSDALSGIVLDDSIYVDTRGQRQNAAPSFDMEGPRFFEPQNPNPGWFSEESISELVYDLVDTAADGADQLAMSFAALVAVMRNAHRTTPALTSIFSFIEGLKSANPAEAVLVDALVTGQGITAVADAYGTGETNDGGSANGDVLPVYASLGVNAAPINLCSTDEFTSASTGASNKLGSRRFLRFSVGAAATHSFHAVATEIPVGQVADPDLVLHRSGFLAKSEGPPAADCSDAQPANCVESFTRLLAPGDYVLEVYEFTNTESEDSLTPPIGRTCFDVSITEP